MTSHQFLTLLYCGALWWSRIALVSLGNSAVLPQTCEGTQWQQKRSLLPFPSAWVPKIPILWCWGISTCLPDLGAPSPGPSLLHQPTRTPSHHPTTALLLVVQSHQRESFPNQPSPAPPRLPFLSLSMTPVPPSSLVSFHVLSIKEQVFS